MLILSPRIKAGTILFIMLLCSGAFSAAPARTALDDLLDTREPHRQDDLERTYQYKLDRGAENLSLASSLLIRASARALRAGRDEEARLYAEYAVKIAPGYPPVYLHSARVSWAQERFRLDKLGTALYHYLHATVTGYFPAVFLLSSIVTFFFIAVLMTILIVSLVSCCKYFKLFVHDLSHRLPLLMPRHFSWCCALLILVLPLFFRLSVLLLPFYWLLLLFVYHTRREQVLIILYAFFLLLSPFLLQVLAQLVVTNAHGVFYQVYQVHEDNWDDETTKVLSAHLILHPQDTDALFALSLIKKREGNIEVAQRSYERLLQIDPLNCSVWCNLGNALLAARKPKAALTHYNRSLELCPESAVAYYNLSRVQLMEYLFTESNKSFNMAKELDPDAVNRFLQIYSEHPNRLVVDRTFSARDFWQHTFMRTEDKESFDAYLWERFFAGIPYKYRHAVSCLCLLFVALLLTDRSRLTRALACEYCGCAVCTKCKRLVTEHRLCKQCASIFKGKKDLMMSIAGKESQAGAIERFHGRQIFISRLFALLLPGSGQLLLDSPCTGTSILFLFFFFLLTIVAGDRFVVNPLQLMPSYFATGISAVLLTALYVYSLWYFNRSSNKLSQFLSLIRVTRREFQIKD